MNLPGKLTLCLDFDGVIHSYVSGWKGADVIPDPPVPGAIEALLAYTEHFVVCVHSTRFNTANYDPPTKEWTEHSSMDAVKDWLILYGIPAFQIVMDADGLFLGDKGPPDGMILLCCTKPPALMTIDDRAITFDGTFPAVETIQAFRPWNKQEV